MKNYVTLIVALFTITLLQCDLTAQNVISYDNTTAKDIPQIKIVQKILENAINDTSLSTSPYINITKIKSRNGTLSVGFIRRSTNDTMFSGNSTSDTIDLNDCLQLEVDENGAYTYKVMPQSPKYLWISDFVNDTVLDTLEIPAKFIGDCHSEYDASVVQKSESDFVFCYYNNRREPKKFLILKNYLKNDSMTHLRLKTVMGDFFMIIPEDWLPSNSIGPYYGNDWNEMYSLKDGVILLRGLPIFSGDIFPIFNVYDNNCTFYLLNDKKSAFSVNMYINDGRGNAEAMYVRLMNFYRNGTVSDAWRDKYFIVIYDDNTPQKILTVNDLLPYTIRRHQYIKKETTYMYGPSF